MDLLHVFHEARDSLQREDVLSLPLEPVLVAPIPARILREVCVRETVAEVDLMD